MKIKLDYNYILKGLLIFVVGCTILQTIFMWNVKNQSFREYNNMNITYGKFIETDIRGRGATLLRYTFYVNNKEFEGSISRATFSEINPTINQSFVVVYNYKNPKESIMFFNLEVNDSIKPLFKKNGIKRIPIKHYQQTIDDFYYFVLFKGVSRFFPPYYDKEDFPELKYLWEENGEE